MKEKREKTDTDRETAENFWDSIKSEVETKLKSLFDFARLDEGRREETIRIMVEREHNFVLQVLSMAQEIKGGNHDESIALFDIDETIATLSYEDMKNPKTILRFSLFFIFEKLKSMGFRIGLFTSRVKVSKELEDPNHLAGIEEQIDSTLVFSCAKETDENFLLFCEKLKTEYGGAEGVLDSEKINDQLLNLLTKGDQLKIELLGRIRKDVQGKSVMIVDDDSTHYTEILNKKNGFHGVLLGQGEQGGKFTIPLSVKLKKR